MPPRPQFTDELRKAVVVSMNCVVKMRELISTDSFDLSFIKGGCKSPIPDQSVGLLGWNS
jgi:hypothetical protein